MINKHKKKQTFMNNDITLLKSILLILYLSININTQTQTIQFQIIPQISTCLAPCLHCLPNQPYKCLNYKNQSTLTPSCIPFHRGTNCTSISYGYQNILRQNQTFQAWSESKTMTCKLLQVNKQGKQVQLGNNRTIQTLGPFTYNQSIFKNILLPQGQNHRIAIRFSLSIADANLPQLLKQSNSSTDSNSFSQILPNGTQIITIIQTQTITQTTTIFTGPKLFIVQFIQTQNQSLLLLQQGKILQTKIISFNQQPITRTNCGWVYQYQLRHDMIKNYNMIGIRIKPIKQINKNIKYFLINFQVNLGCRGFVVNSNQRSYNCDACLSGFYPVKARNSNMNEELEQCKRCDKRCKTCNTAMTCLTCAQDTVYNIDTRMCQFTEFFGFQDKANIVIGDPLNTTTLFDDDIIKNVQNVIIINQPLQKVQPYTVSMDLLYTAAFQQSKQNLQIFIDNILHTVPTSTLPLTSAAKIPGIASNNSDIYVHKLTFPMPAPKQSIFKSQIQLRLITNQTQNQFAITNLKTIQFTCGKNCLQCNYSSFTQLSQCKKCQNFFDLQTNCLSCAKGYYLANSNTKQQICIKCHSTCKQCTGPNIQDCISCFDGFYLGSMIFDYKCIDCLYQKTRIKNQTLIQSCLSNLNCTKQHQIEQVLTNQNCKLCFQDKNTLTTSNVCKLCWLQQSLAHSSCDPTPERGYHHYGSDISSGIVTNQWTSNKNLMKKTLNDQYKDLYGVDYNVNDKNQTTILTFRQPSLPSHRGMTIFFNIFKVNTWGSTNNQSTTNNNNTTNSNNTTNNTTNPNNNPSNSSASTLQSINILIKSSSSPTIIRNQTIFINNTFGNNIYGGFGSGNQMIYTFVGNYLDHTDQGQTQIIITGTNTGLFLNNLQIYLGNCPSCISNTISYQMYYIPMYTTNQTQTGIDIWLSFYQGALFVTKDTLITNEIIKSFQFSIDVLGYENLLPAVLRENKLNLWNYVKFFIPLNKTLINGTLRVNSTLGSNVFLNVKEDNKNNDNSTTNNTTKTTRRRLELVQQVQENQKQYHRTRLLINQRLDSKNIQQKIHRYQLTDQDQRKSMAQLQSFYNFIQWFTLIVMIITIFLGIGVIFQQFSILVQLLFLHIYVSTNILPSTFKRPLSGMQKIQNLNYFSYSDLQNIQASWFGQISQQSPYPLMQYNVDIYFTRSMYPLIIINIVYLGWFIIWFILLKLIKQFKNSPNKIIKFFRDIPQRPLNYFDQIWRYQFITTIWSCFIQFHYFDDQTSLNKLNLAICIISFIISIIWPIFIIIYTYHQHNILSVQHFAYLYNDIYYKKISSIADKLSFYLYILVRFGRYLFYVIFIAIFVYQNIVGPVILIAVTLLEFIYLINFKIYRDKALFAFKIVENLMWIIVEILLLIIYAFSDSSLDEEGYQNLGYGISTLYVLMIINGTIRFFYLTYKKIIDLKNGRYDHGEKGEIVNFDGKNNPVIEIPNTERGFNQ